MTVEIESVEALKGMVGTHLGYGEYHRVTQEEVNIFADATGDHQWIPVDPERAKAESPFGGPIAHGYLTLSLIPLLMSGMMRVGGIKMGVNYGTNKVRFPSPVPVGSDVRAGASIAAVEEIPGGVQVALDVTVEVKDAPKPSCVAQVVFRYYV